MFIVLSAIALFGYGSYGVWKNDFYFPSKYRPHGLHLHGLPAWIMYGAVLSFCLFMLSVVVSHYDTRSNERAYKRFAKICKFSAYSLFFISIIVRVAGPAQAG